MSRIAVITGLIVVTILDFGSTYVALKWFDQYFSEGYFYTKMIIDGLGLDLAVLVLLLASGGVIYTINRFWQSEFMRFVARTFLLIKSLVVCWNFFAFVIVFRAIYYSG